MVPQIDDFLSIICELYYEGTQHTPQVSMDFPVGFASTGSGKSLSGLYGFFCYLAGAGGQRRGAAIDHLRVGPLSFWSPEGGQKNELKN